MPTVTPASPNHLGGGLPVLFAFLHNFSQWLGFAACSHTCTCNLFCIVQIEIESEEVLRKDKELIGTVNRPAEANRFKVETLAEGAKEAKINTARGEAEAIKLIGSAEASTTLAIGEAEAEAMKVKAEAFKTYGDAAITEMILNVLPLVAKEAAKPLENVADIVLLSGGDDGVTSEITKLMSTLPPVVQAVSGVDLKQMVGSMTNM